MVIAMARIVALNRMLQLVVVGAVYVKSISRHSFISCKLAKAQIVGRRSVGLTTIAAFAGGVRKD